MMRSILPRDMPSTVSPVDPGRHRPLVGVHTPVGQQIQLRVEQLPIQFVQRQTTPAALTEDTQHRFGVSAFRIPPGFEISNHLAPFAHVDGFPALPGGALLPRLLRACVTIGLAPLRRSHVRPCHTCIA